MAPTVSPELQKVIQEFSDLVFKALPPADVCNNYGKLVNAARQHGTVDVKDLLEQRVVQRFDQLLSDSVAGRTLAHVAKAGHGWESVCLLDLVRIFGSAILSSRHNDAHKCLRAFADAGISLLDAEAAVSAAHQHRQLQGQSQGVKRSPDPALADFRTASKALFSQVSEPTSTASTPPEINAEQSHMASSCDVEEVRTIFESDDEDNDGDPGTRGRGPQTPHPNIQVSMAKRLPNVLFHGPRKRRRLQHTTLKARVDKVDGASTDLDGGLSSPEPSVEVGRGTKSSDQWDLFDNHDMSIASSNALVHYETDCDEESNFSTGSDDEYGHCNYDDAESHARPDPGPHTPESLPPIPTEHGKPQTHDLKASGVTSQPSAKGPRAGLQNKQSSYDQQETVPAITVSAPTRNTTGQQAPTDERFDLRVERVSEKLSYCSPAFEMVVAAGNSMIQPILAELKHDLVQPEPLVEQSEKMIELVDINHVGDEQASTHHSSPGERFSLARSTLLPRQWLSSSVFDAVFETFRRPDTHIFDCLHISVLNSHTHTQTFSKCKKLIGYKKFLIPLYHVKPVRHWTIAFVDLDDAVISHYDSLGYVHNTSDVAKLALISFFQRPDLIITQMNGPQQTNSYDCGILAIVVGLGRLFELEIPEQVNCEIWRKLFVEIMDYNLAFVCPDGDGVLPRVMDGRNSKNSVYCNDFADATKHTGILETLRDHQDNIQTELHFIQRIVKCNAKHFLDEQHKVRSYQKAIRQAIHDEEAILQLSTVAQSACLAALREVITQAKTFIRRFASSPARSTIITMLESEVERMIKRGRDSLNEIEKALDEEREELRKTTQRRQDTYVRLTDLLTSNCI